jgi:hypothetical protein
LAAKLILGSLLYLKIEFPELNHNYLKILAIAQYNWNIPINALKYSEFEGKSLKQELLHNYENKKLNYRLEDFKLEYQTDISKIVVDGVGHFFAVIHNLD